MESRRFRKPDRIKASSDFQRNRERGRRVHGNSVFLVESRQDLGRARLGVVVTRKTGNAVVRNRWKRVAREAFRLQFNARSASKDLVVIVRSSIRRMPNRTDALEMDRLISQALKK